MAHKIEKALVGVLIGMLLASCGGGSKNAAGVALTDGSHAVQAGTAQSTFARGQPPTAALRAAALVDATNLMDWAELRYPQYFPSHREPQLSPPYIYRYYPETNTYLGVDGQFVRVLGPSFGPNILTVGTLMQFVCDVFPESCTPPTANAGAPQEVYVGTTVTLNGAGSADGNGRPLTYSWTLLSKPAGSLAALSGVSSAHPTFIADVAGVYVAALVVNNGNTSSVAANVSVSSVIANVAPVANAGGSRSVVAGTAVFLSGTSSYDQNGDALTYQWTLSTAFGSGAALVNAISATPYFTPDVAGTYVATLVVNDGRVNSAPASVSITATAQSTYCCKHCTTGKPCGDTCISNSYTCHTPGGCACY
ncbi:MAG: hypothetical protein JWQ07_108 [Ramlibacter sp.]|nr:hypothetical protein [Ramlibacter sp.]